jgi:hypothetical protein
MAASARIGKPPIIAEYSYECETARAFGLLFFVVRDEAHRGLALARITVVQNCSTIAWSALFVASSRIRIFG